MTLLPGFVVASNTDKLGTGATNLKHRHYQGGLFDFPFLKAASLKTIETSDARIEILLHPAAALRISATEPQAVVETAERLLSAWRSAALPGLAVDLSVQTASLCGQLLDGRYSLSMLPRNGELRFLTRPSIQAIKKEFLGVFEMIGYAILPSRTEAQLNAIQACLSAGKELPEELGTHRAWVEEFCAGGDVWAALEASFVAMIGDNSPYQYDNVELALAWLAAAGIKPE